MPPIPITRSSVYLPTTTVPTRRWTRDSRSTACSVMTGDSSGQALRGMRERLRERGKVCARARRIAREQTREKERTKPKNAGARGAKRALDERGAYHREALRIALAL